MAEKTMIKAAYITAGGAIVAAIIGGLFLYYSSHTSKVDLEKRPMRVDALENTGNFENESALKKNKELENRKDALKKETHLLHTEVDALKKKLTSGKVNIHKTITNTKEPEKIEQTNAKEIIEAISSMYSSDVAKFLVEIIPTLKGGVSCADLATMLSYGNSSQGATVIKKLAPYVQRPFPPGCFKKLSNQIYSSDAAEALEFLIKSKPMY